MTIPPRPPNEKLRLEALRRYHILDTPPDQEFDELVQLASRICSAPIAAITLIDENRQWLKAKVGLDIDETPRDLAFCAHAILQKELLIVPDAMADNRFSENPLVKGEPYIRFYAGAPLITSDGLPLGSLCVIDRRRRELTQKQVEALRVLSHQAVTLLEFKRTRELLRGTLAESKMKEDELRASEEFKTRMIESSLDCIKVLDLDGRLLSMNAGGMRTLEICDFATVANSKWVEFWQGEDREKAMVAIQSAINGGSSRFTGFCPTAGGKPMWWDVVVNPILNAEGEPERLLAVSRDITEQKRAEHAIRAITEATASVTAGDFFRSLVRHVAHALNARYAFVAECTDEKNSRVGTLAFWSGNDFTENVSFDLTGTPCENVIAGKVCYYPDQIQTLFPLDTPLVDMQAHGYLGVPIQDPNGRILGHLAVLDDKPMNVKQSDQAILTVFATRASAEIQRKRADEALRTALSEVEKLKNQLQAEVIYLQEEIQTQFEEIVGNSPAIRKVFQNIQKVAPTDSTVLVTGETGTGKELVARAIHHLSSQKDRALITINCAALPAGLIESELFGHEKGAFTGALARKKGRFELADNGTLFLDEIGELPLETQAKLMRVLQEREFERVGGTQTLKVTVRVIAATNRDLRELVKKGAFRADLFYRLNIFPVHLPPLRERRDDIALLTNYFVARFSRRMGKKIDRVSPEALKLLAEYEWPGNVRELANLLERAVILCEGIVLQPHHLAIARSEPPVEPEVSTLEETERAHILKALEKTKWVVGGPGGAARILGLNRTTLIARMKKLGIERPSVN
jgi:PAS domain S-box-containing protein